MALSAFDDPARPPDTAMLRRCLGGAARLWADLVAHVTATCPPIEEAWGFSGAKFGWSLRLKRDERVLIYLTPQEGCFLAGLVLGEKAVAAAAENGLPPAVLSILEAAPRYAEGRGIRLTISPGDTLGTLRHLVELKAVVPPKGRRRSPVAARPGEEAPAPRQDARRTAKAAPRAQGPATAKARSRT